MAKGGSFENEICKDLSRWWTDGKRDDIFRRTSTSGGLATIRRKSGKTTAYQHGDITFQDDIGKPFIERYNIECKSGYATQNKWDVLDLLDSKQKVTTLEKLWEQCLNDAEVSNREPMLIFRRNGRGKCIIIKTNEFRSLSKYFGMFPCVSFDFCFGGPSYTYDIFVAKLSDFLYYVTPEIIKLISNVNKIG